MSEVINVYGIELTPLDAKKSKVHTLITETQLAISEVLPFVEERNKLKLLKQIQKLNKIASKISKCE